MTKARRRSAAWFVAIALVILPASAYAQEATMSGTVTDTSGAAMPGVTVTAVHQATGNTFFVTTDGR